MWDLSVLPELADGLNPTTHSFTYTYPPPYRAWAASLPGGISENVHAGWPDFSGYIHIPFCRMNCGFCSLHREVARQDGLVGDYLKSLVRELTLVAPRITGVPMCALYIGGGTPSMLSPTQLGEVLDAAAALACVGAGEPVEVTIECAPDPAVCESGWSGFFGPLIARKRLPVTRVSAGVQAWDDDTLKRMGRADTRKAAVRLLRVIDRELPVYNVDFVMGYPSGKGIEWEAHEIVRAVAELKASGLSLPNVSVYQLWDVDTLFLANRRRALLPAQGAVVAALNLVQEGLHKMGYFGTGGATFVSADEHRHVWTRHRNIHFRHLGFGSGSYSFLPCGFVQRDRDIRRYARLVHTADLATMDRLLNHGYQLTAEDVEIRRVIMGLRSGEPVMRTHEAAPNTPRLRELATKVDRLLQAGFLDERDGGRVFLPRHAFLLSNSISAFLHPADVPRKSHA